jgi:hypothetical protein
MLAGQQNYIIGQQKIADRHRRMLAGQQNCRTGLV